MEDININKPKLHLFICINDRSNAQDNFIPSCGPRITEDDVNKIKYWIREKGWTMNVYCTKALCLGFCNAEGSVLALYPKGRFVKGIKSIDIDTIVNNSIAKIHS